MQDVTSWNVTGLCIYWSSTEAAKFESPLRLIESIMSLIRCDPHSCYPCIAFLLTQDFRRFVRHAASTGCSRSLEVFGRRIPWGGLKKYERKRAWIPPWYEFIVFCNAFQRQNVRSRREIILWPVLRIRTLRTDPNPWLNSLGGWHSSMLETKQNFLRPIQKPFWP